jgi:hypothetical protein
MKNRIYAVAIISVFLSLVIGAALAQEETSGPEREISITNASFVAPSPERENLNMEWVEISNQGASDENMAGWKLEDRQNHTYTFQDFILKAGSSAKIHTGTGSDTSDDLYWNRNTPIWNNDGDTATLTDAAGNIVSSYPEESEGA